MTGTEEFWKGEAEARIKGAEARLNALNGDLREIRSHMGSSRDNLLLLTQRVNSLDTNVTKLLAKTEEDQARQLEAMQAVLSQARIRTRNLIFMLAVPLIAAMISGLIPYLLLGGPHK